MKSLIEWISLQPNWSDWVARAGRIGLVLAGTVLAYVIVRKAGQRLAGLANTEGSSQTDVVQQRHTIVAVVTNTGLTVIGLIALMMILGQLGIDLAPILATAGIAGLAIGFGAQTLVKDVISGVFILFENQYALGDAVKAAGVSGVVEEIRLRTTSLRDVHGTLHVIPNGEIRVLSNQSKEWSRAVVEVGVGYGEDPDRVIDVLEAVGRDLAEDDVFGPLLLEPPTVPGVQALADSAVVIRMMVKTMELRQFEVERELRRRIFKRFRDEGIEIPFPQRVVWHRSAEEDSDASDR